MDYHQSVEFLEELSRFGINLGLERIEELLSRLGNPHKQGMKIIHVAGTNGKGSTSAMLESILRCHYKTGLFTSPHLHSVRERFRINGRSISEEKLAQLITEMVPYWQQMQDDGFEAPTEFEMHTALALKYFADEKVDYAVLEAGLGGDYDSTKAADGNMAIITNISLDHMEYLGDNFHDIAKSKSGIINENATVLTGAYAGSLDIIRHKAEEKHASVEALGEELKYRHVMDVATKGQYFSLRTPRNKYESLYIPLLGRHQIANASLSVAMAELLGMDKESIAKGLARVCWPGRLELIGRKPMILLDGAHNYRGMEALAETLQIYWPQKRIIAVLGMLADKERQKALDMILPQLSKVIVSRPPIERAGDWQILIDICQQKGVPALAIEDVGQACQSALDMAGEHDLILICGSLYLIAEARAWFMNKQDEAAQPVIFDKQDKQGDD